MHSNDFLILLLSPWTFCMKTTLLLTPCSDVWVNSPIPQWRNTRIFLGEASTIGLGIHVLPTLRGPKMSYLLSWKRRVWGAGTGWAFFSRSSICLRDFVTLKHRSLIWLLPWPNGALFILVLLLKSTQKVKVTVDFCFPPDAATDTYSLFSSLLLLFTRIP